MHRSIPFWFAAVLTMALPAQGEKRPNVILCMSDDQGWGDVGYNGHPVLKTPCLDAMAASGLRFDRFYAAAPVCSPTRGSVLTGRHPNRFGCFAWGHTLRPQERTLAEELRDAGYTTGHFGKWHLGSMRAGGLNSPGESGFDEWVSSPNFYENSPQFSRNGEAISTDGESSRVTVDVALDFINRAAAKDKPFLAVIWFGNPHTPHQALPEVREPYADQPAKAAHYYGEITGIDRAMAHLRNQLRELDIADHTLVWYTSDNGSRKPGSTGGLRGSKGTLWEGGIRVPAIIEWPSRVSSPRVTTIPCGTVDIYPTVLRACGVTPRGPEMPMDGIDLMGLIDGEMTERDKPMGFWVYPARGRRMRSAEIITALAAGQASGEASATADPEAPEKPRASGFPGHAAWTEGSYKLHRIPAKKGDHSYALFDLENDPKESRDLALEQPQRVKKIRADLASWQK